MPDLELDASAEGFRVDPELEAEESSDKLGGEPLKVEASSSPPGSEVSASPAATPSPVKLELPMKLLRLDASSVQITQYEQEEGDLEDEEEPSEQLLSSPSEWTFDLPERSLSLPDAATEAWCSPLADAWSPWLGMKPELSPNPMMMPFCVGEPLEAGDAAASLELLSQGSALHASGRCRPCAWFWKPGSCQNQENCSYCHLCPEGELKARKKAKVAMMRLGVVTPKAKASPEAEAPAGNVLKLSSLL